MKLSQFDSEKWRDNETSNGCLDYGILTLYRLRPLRVETTAEPGTTEIDVAGSSPEELISRGDLPRDQACEPEEETEIEIQSRCSLTPLEIVKLNSSPDVPKISQQLGLSVYEIPDSECAPYLNFPPTAYPSACLKNTATVCRIFCPSDDPVLTAWRLLESPQHKDSLAALQTKIKNIKTIQEFPPSLLRNLLWVGCHSPERILEYETDVRGHKKFAIDKLMSVLVQDVQKVFITRTDNKKIAQVILESSMNPLTNSVLFGGAKLQTRHKLTLVDELVCQYDVECELVKDKQPAKYHPAYYIQRYLENMLISDMWYLRQQHIDAL